MVIGVKVEENIVGITEGLKPGELGCGDWEEPTKFLLSRVDNGEVVFVLVLLSNTAVIFGVVDMVALV